MNRLTSHATGQATPYVSPGMTIVLVAAVSSGLVVAGPAFPGSEPPKAPTSAIQETRLFNAAQLRPIATIESPDHHHLALVVQERSSDGFPGLPTCTLGSPSGATPSTASTGPKLFHQKAYLSSDTAYRVYFDDHASTLYSKVCQYSVAISPDSRHIAFAASPDSLPPKGSLYLEPVRTWCMVFDSVASPAYDDVSSPTFSPDGLHFAYLALRENECFLVLDGRPGPSFAPRARQIVTFSSDGDHAAYVAATRDSQFVVADGQRGPGFVQVGDLTLRFSDDGSRLAYFVAPDKEGKRVAAVVDGQAGQAWDTILGVSPAGFETPKNPWDADTPSEREAFSSGIVFSGDSRHYAYAAVASTEQFVVVDGQPSPAYEAVFPPVFRGAGAEVWYAAREQGKWFLVRNGVPDQDRYDELQYNAVTPPPGDHWAYAVREGKRWTVVVDGRRGPKADEVWIMDLVFSPGGNRCAYPARMGKKEHVILDGQVGAAWDRVGSICFSPDGQHVAYSVKKGEQVFVLADGMAGPVVTEVGNRGVRFVPDGSAVEYLATRDGTLYNIRQALVPPPGGN